MTFELWIEKYRPRTLDEVVDQEDVIRALKGFVKKKSMP
ncbi:MAG: replication factor C small subunit, partial [Thermoproteota archaeon]